MAQSLEHRLLVEKVPSSVLSLSINNIVLKNSDESTGSPEYTGTDVLVKSVESKVSTVRAMSPKFIVGCQLRCRNRHLSVVLNNEA